MAAPELCFGFVGVEAMGVGVGYCCVEDCERSLEGGGRGGGGGWKWGEEGGEGGEAESELTMWTTVGMSQEVGGGDGLSKMTCVTDRI